MPRGEVSLALPLPEQPRGRTAVASPSHLRRQKVNPRAHVILFYSSISQSSNMYRPHLYTYYTPYVCTYLYMSTQQPTRLQTLPRTRPSWSPSALPGSLEVLCFFFFFLLLKRRPFPPEGSSPQTQIPSLNTLKYSFLKKRMKFPSAKVVPGDGGPSLLSLEGESTPSCRHGGPEGRRGPQRPRAPCSLWPCARPAKGYSVKGTCQMRRALSVSPHGAGLPLPPGGALPKLR